MKKVGGKKRTACRGTHHKVQPIQELQNMKWALEEKIAKEKEAIANYQAQLEINHLQQTLNQLQREKQGTVQGAKLDLENNGFRIDYIDESILTKAKEVNLIQAINCINNIVGKDKCLSLLETMGLVEPKPTSNTVSTSEKSSPTSSQPDKGKYNTTKSDCQILTTSDVSDTSEGQVSRGESSGDSDDGKSKKKRGKKKLKSSMTVKAKDAGIKVKVKWAQSMLGTKKEINFDDMDFNWFVFGESRLINRNKIDQKEKEY